MLKVGEVQQVLAEGGADAGDSDDAPIINFIRALGVVYSNRQELRGRLEVQRRVLEYLGDAVRHLVPVLRSLVPAALSATYSLAGNICKHCAHVIYVPVRPPDGISYFYDATNVAALVLIGGIVFVTTSTAPPSCHQHSANQLVPLFKRKIEFIKWKHTFFCTKFCQQSVLSLSTKLTQNFILEINFLGKKGSMFQTQGNPNTESFFVVCRTFWSGTKGVFVHRTQSLFPTCGPRKPVHACLFALYSVLVVLFAA